MSEAKSGTLPRIALRSIRATGVGALLLLASASLAQPYPSRPIRIIVPNTAGAAQDIAGRIVAQRLAESMGQQTVVDNRAGATGQIGMEIAAKAVPDGYTLIFATQAGLVLNPLLTKVPYDTFKDYTPISLIVTSPQLLFATMGIPAKTLGELLELARQKPGQLNCASPGFGTSNHLGCEMVKTVGKVNFVHVPYKGTAPAITDVVGGQVQFMFNSIPAVLQLIKTGKLRAIAHGGTRRSPVLPDVPTVAETLPGVEVGTWYALVGPAGIPAAITARLNDEIKKMFADPQFVQKFTDMGQDPAPTSPAGLTAHMRADSKRWAGIIQAAGLKPER